MYVQLNNSSLGESKKDKKKKKSHCLFCLQGSILTHTHTLKLLLFNFRSDLSYLPFTSSSGASYIESSSALHMKDIENHREIIWWKGNQKRKKKGITDLYRILFNGGHQVDDGSSNNDLSIKWEIKKRAFPSNFFFPSSWCSQHSIQDVKVHEEEEEGRDLGCSK